MQTLNGFIKLHRKLIAWGWYQDSVVKDVFLHLLLTASFKDTMWRDVPIKKGQLITSYSHLAEDLGFSVHQIRNALSKLEITGEVARKSTNKYTIITIENWEEYQIFEEDEAHNTSNKGQTNGKQTANKGQHRNNVNNKRIQEYKKENIKEKSSTRQPAWAAVGLTKEEFEELKNQ